MNTQVMRLLAGFVLALSVSMAHATLMVSPPSDPAVVTGSWLLGTFPLTSSSPYDTLEFFIQDDTGAGPFEDPAVHEAVHFVLTPTFTTQLINPGYVLATGPATTTTHFNLFFAGDIAEAVNVDLFAYVSGTLLGGLELQFNSGNYLGYTSANDPTGQNYNRVASVPEPSVLALMGIGLAGMGFSRKRMKGA